MSQSLRFIRAVFRTSGPHGQRTIGESRCVSREVLLSLALRVDANREVVRRSTSGLRAAS